MNDNSAMRGIRFVVDEKGRKSAIIIDLKMHGPVLEDLLDGLVSESRQDAKSVPYEHYRAKRLNRSRTQSSEG